MTPPDRPFPYAFGTQHDFNCKALMDWNDIEASSCTCGAYLYGVETGRCEYHDMLLTPNGTCKACQQSFDNWIERKL